MQAQNDKVAECLKGWVEFCHGIHTETWEAKRRETEEALEEYRQQMKGEASG